MSVFPSFIFPLMKVPLSPTFTLSARSLSTSFTFIFDCLENVFCPCLLSVSHPPSILVSPSFKLSSNSRLASEYNVSSSLPFSTILQKSFPGPGLYHMLFLFISLPDDKYSSTFPSLSSRMNPECSKFSSFINSLFIFPLPILFSLSSFHKLCLLSCLLSFSGGWLFMSLHSPYLDGSTSDISRGRLSSFFPFCPTISSGG